jgi:hypothetical protein
LGEQTDLSKKESARFKTMVAAMEQRLKETNAQRPTENPDYDPDAVHQQPRQRRNR